MVIFTKAKKSTQPTLLLQILPKGFDDHLRKADAVLIGRPFVNVIYGAGEEGVKIYVERLKAELADTMTMCGAKSLEEITRDMLFFP